MSIWPLGHFQFLLVSQMTLLQKDITRKKERLIGTINWNNIQLISIIRILTTLLSLVAWPVVLGWCFCSLLRKICMVFPFADDYYCIYDYFIIIHTSSIPAPCFQCKVLLTSRMGEFMTVETIIVLYAWTTHWATKKKIIKKCCHLLEWFGVICFLNVPNWNFLKKHQKTFLSWFSAKYPALIFTSLWKNLWGFSCSIYSLTNIQLQNLITCSSKSRGFSAVIFPRTKHTTACGTMLKLGVDSHPCRLILKWMCSLIYRFLLDIVISVVMILSYPWQGLYSFWLS